MEVFFFLVLSTLHVVCSGLRHTVFQFSDKSESKKPNDINIDRNAEPEKLTNPDWFIFNSDNDINERFLMLENKVKLLEERENSRDEVARHLQKSIIKLKKQNTNLKKRLELLHGADKHRTYTDNQINVNNKGMNNIPGQSYKDDDFIRENVYPTQGDPPNITIDESADIQHTDVRDIYQIVSKTGTIRFNAQPLKRVTYSGNKIVQFPDVTINVGNGFSNTTGVFKCPKSGLYIFGLTISASPNLATVYIFQNNNWVARTFVGSNFGTASVVSILQMNAGDKVMVVNAENQQNTFDQFSHFTGARISD